jgi:hypothetical protein
MKLVWDKVGERYYETGTKNGVLYKQNSDGTYPLGVAWSGLTGVTESPSGGDANDIYADDMKYLSLRGAEDFGGTITCYSYPEEWEECDGSAEPVAGLTIGQQVRKPFGMVYKSVKGNDTEKEDYGYKLHLIYNATASPSERAYQTINDSPEAIEFSYEFTTIPSPITGYKPMSIMTVDSTKIDADKLKNLEDVLFGTASSDPRLPLPDEVVEILRNSTVTPSISVIPTEAATTVGGTVELRTEVTPTGTAVTWTSDDTDKATVDENGVVTGVAAGTATITGTITVDGHDHTDTSTVTVTAPAANG